MPMARASSYSEIRPRLVHARRYCMHDTLATQGERKGHHSATARRKTNVVTHYRVITRPVTQKTRSSSASAFAANLVSSEFAPHHERGGTAEHLRPSVALQLRAPASRAGPSPLPEAEWGGMRGGRPLARSASCALGRAATLTTRGPNASDRPASVNWPER